MEWTKYTTKETLKDNDELMILDKDANANKRTLMDKIWNYVVDKMTTAVIAKLGTTNKTLIGAVNELNSNAKRKDITGKSISIDLQMYKTAIVFGTINTTSETLLLVTRQYNDVVVVESLHGASKEGVIGIVDSNTNTVTITFPGNNSAIIIW